jgi:hypothetical protein
VLEDTFAPLQLTGDGQEIALAGDFAWCRLDSPPDRKNTAWVHEWRTENGRPTLSLARQDDGLLLRFPNLADFSINNDGNRIGVWPAPGTDDETLRHLLLDQVLPRLLAHQGRLVLHAGAVRVDDTAIAFLGATGCGKSTLTASFRTTGYSLLSDDGLVLNPIEEEVKALPTYPSLRLWPESVAGVYSEPPTLAPMAQYSTKQRVVLTKDDFSGEPLPLAAIYVLAPVHETGASTISLTRLPPRDACMAIVENSFQLDLTGTRRAAALLAKAAKVAKQVPAFRLSYPRDFALLPSVRAAILDQRSSETRCAAPGPSGESHG